MRNLFLSEKPPLWVIFFSKSLLNGWNHVKKKNVSKDSSYQIYFTEIDSWICNLKELTQPAKLLPLSAVKAMISFHIRSDRWCDRSVFFSVFFRLTRSKTCQIYTKHVTVKRLKSWAFRVGAPSPLACLPLFHPFFLAPTVYFQASATEARKILNRGLNSSTMP